MLWSITSVESEERYFRSHCRAWMGREVARSAHRAPARPEGALTHRPAPQQG
jgi:hypothetical protein